MLARAYNLFTDDDDDKTGLEIVASEQDGGEFDNRDGRFNGKFYMGYSYEDGGEYYEEKIVVFI